MAAPQFTLGAASITLSKAPSYPVRAPRERIQAIDRTAAGTIIVESLGAGINRREMTFANLTEADFDALRNWYDVVANGAANSFTVIDEDGLEYTARWINTFDFSQEKAGWSGTIELEIVG